MNKEEKFEIELNQEDVQNIINCYEKDIKLIEQLQQENKELKELYETQTNFNKELLNKLAKKDRENKELKEKFLKQTTETYLRQTRIDKAIELLSHFSGCQICEHTQELAIKVEEILKDSDVDE